MEVVNGVCMVRCHAIKDVVIDVRVVFLSPIQHGCTVGVLPGPTRVLPMPRQYGIGRRAPTRAVLSCAASWCLVVRRPRRRVDCLVLTFCYVSSRTPRNK